MQRLAKALDVRPIELIEAAIAAEYATDVVPVEPTLAGPYAAALSLKNLKLYEVVSSSMARAGFASGDRAIIDQSVTDFADVQAGSTVVVEIRTDDDTILCLRHFIPPTLLVSNGFAYSDVLNFGALPVRVSLVGVVIQRIPATGGNGHNPL
jgi:SOS-response transcriptional repressor LexA